LTRAAARALLPFAVHGLTRQVDAAVGLLLHTTLDLPDFVPQALRLMDAADTIRGVAAWTAGGAAVWLAMAAFRARRERRSLASALESEASGFAPLLLRPALTLLALASLLARPTYPYGFTLPVALTQDWGPAQDALALAALVAWRLPIAARVPVPGAGAVWFIAFVAYGTLSPGWARDWDSHPGNEPKTLRMAVALGHGLGLDVEGVSAPMEQLQPRPLLAAIAAGARTVVVQSAHMVGALARGPDAVGRGAIRATRVTRQTVRGKEGGVYHILAPGVSLALAPLLRADRALNLRHGTPGRLGLTLLAWNALAALTIAAVFLFLREVTGRPGLAALLATGAALAPPFVFYSYQFYPELPGALLLVAIFRIVLLDRRWSARALGRLGLLLAVLPWLHQKFVPLWLLLTAMVVVMAVERLVRLGELIALVVPQLAVAWLFALYNFAITGSVRPDALYLAWGPGGVSGARVGLGLFGLMLDARYGLLPYAPFYLLAAAGIAVKGAVAARLRLALPAAAVYYLTIASADNWTGAVSSLGRYVMPLAPYLLALAAVAIHRVDRRRGLVGVVLAMAAWTGMIAVQLWRDPHAANDCALLLAKSAYADGNVYVPNLFLRSWSEAAAGTAARIAAWLVLAALLAVWLRRAGPSGDSPPRAIAAATAVVLAAAFVLERWPSVRTAAHHSGVELSAGTTVFIADAETRPDGTIVAPPGDVDVIVRSRAPLYRIVLVGRGQGAARAARRPPVALTPAGAALEVPLGDGWSFTGRRGVSERLYRTRMSLESGAPVTLTPVRMEEPDVSRAR
jgi:hypothetical protein